MILSLSKRRLGTRAFRRFLFVQLVLTNCETIKK